MLGIYEDEILSKSMQSEEKLSEFLPPLLSKLLEEYEFEALVYVNGPGSFMGIKISFLSLQTLSIVKNVPLLAVSAFELNDYQPIRANKNLCFVYEKGQISLQKTQPGAFFLPKNLANLTLKEDNLPFYFLGAI